MHSQRLVWALLGAALLLTIGSVTGAASFKLPAGSDSAVWEAENAKAGAGWERVGHSRASGGGYVGSEEGEAVLEFPFKVKAPTTLRVATGWWRDGDRRSARRFPYPLPAKAGPDAVAVCNGLAFFTAPITGRVGVVDVATGEIIDTLELGGYLTDIVADEEAKMVYVADALNDRVIGFPARRRMASGRKPARTLTSARTPEEPWSLALHQGKLYVGCRAGKCVAQVELPPVAAISVMLLGEGKIVSRIDLRAEVLNIEIVEEPETHLVARFEPTVFNVFDGKLLPTDEQQFPGGARRTSATAPDKTVYDSPEPGKIRIRGGGEETVVEYEGKTEFRTQETADRTATITMALMAERLWFTVPEAGKVGVLDTKAKQVVGSVEVGGLPVDIVADAKRGKVYVADAVGHRVVVIGAQDLTIEKEMSVPDMPYRLEIVQTIDLQRAYLEPPLQANKLFVVCRKGQACLAYDLATNELVAETKLPGEPVTIKPVRMPNPGWWPLLSLERIPFAMQGRVAVDLAPVNLGLEKLEPVAAPEASVGFARHDKALIPGGEGGTETAVTAGTPMLLRMGEDQWVDCTEVVDPQLAPARPLTERDEYGAITLSVDDGFEYDWTNGRWMTPDNQKYLVYDTQEFWRRNAPAFLVKPGAHVLKVRAKGPYANLDRLTVRRCIEGRLKISVQPEPAEVHAKTSLPGYQGVFYDQEPVRLTVSLRNTTAETLNVRLSRELRDYMRETVAEGREEGVVIPPGETVKRELRFKPEEMGRFELAVKAEAKAGSCARIARFVRLPKLEHPRLFFRKDDLPEIRERMAEHPDLFRRYASWLTRMAQTDAEYFSERFLPPGLGRAACASAAPADLKDERQRGQRYGWRMYDLGWRIFACQFMSEFSEYSEAEVLAKVMEPLLAGASTDSYCQFHHHGPFFPGAVAALYDMASEEERQQMPLGEFFAKRMGDMNVMPWMLVALEEPMTPDKRAMVYKIMQYANNADAYLDTHQGSRAGTWWQNPWTGCHCPMQGLSLAYLFTRNLFDEDRLFEKGSMQGILTFNHYVDPIRDKKRILPAINTPNGQPWRWLHAGLSRHPLEQAGSPWPEWLRKLDGDLGTPEEEKVDALLGLDGMPIKGKLGGAASHFVTGCAVPIGLALGWYDPEQEVVELDEPPPTTLFDFEGWATMKSGWDENATEVSFMCGARDHTNRQQPNHFTIVKAGEFMIGTPSTYGDDGNSTPAWGNAVVVGEDWVTGWRRNLYDPRSPERLIINRFSPSTWDYIARDRILTGFKPAENGWGGGLDLHGHTQTPLWAQGQIIAYETRPGLDYVAGDATNAWPVDQVAEMYRQVVYLKPDTVVIYDRVKLRDGELATKWLATTAPGLKARGDGFRAGDGPVAIEGKVLLPERATVSKAERPANFNWKDQELVAIEPTAGGNTVEYLVILQVGDEDVDAPEGEIVRRDGMVGVRMEVGGEVVTVLFRQEGPVGGEVVMGDKRVRLADGINDTYRHWKGDPRFEKWMNEERFRFVVTAGGRGQ